MGISIARGSDLEPGPEVGGGPARASHHLQLASAQSLVGIGTVHEHFPIETDHELPGGGVVDAPESGNQAPGSGLEKSMGDAGDAFSAEVVSRPGVAGTEDHEL